MAGRTNATRSWPVAGLVTACCATAAVASGWAYQVRATARDRRRMSPSGRLVDAGGHDLHLHISGEDRGGPTVVLEAGGMATSPMWAGIQPGIAGFARVVSYDRAGLGWSRPGPAPRDARTIARELHTALGNAGLPGPYVLVGASLGGPYAVVFAATYRDETAGLVLMDSAHPDQLERLPAKARFTLRALRAINRVVPALAQVGITHLVDVSGTLLGGVPSRLPADAGAQLRVFSHWPGHWAAVRDEVAAWDDTMAQMKQAIRDGWLQDLPLLVLTAPDNPGMDDMREPWLEMQRDLAKLSNRAVHQVVEGAGHVSLATEPRFTEKVIDAIREILDT